MYLQNLINSHEAQAENPNKCRPTADNSTGALPVVPELPSTGPPPAHYGSDRSQNAQKPQKMKLMKKVFNTRTSTWKWAARRMVINIAA